MRGIKGWKSSYRCLHFEVFTKTWKCRNILPGRCACLFMNIVVPEASVESLQERKKKQQADEHHVCNEHEPKKLSNTRAGEWQSDLSTFGFCKPLTLMGVWASVTDEQSRRAFKDLWRKPGKQSDEALEAAHISAPACDTCPAELWLDMKRPAPH